MRALAVVIAFTLSGCARTQTQSAPAPQAIRFTNSREAVRSCTSLGLIDSSDKTNGGTVSQTPVERDRYRRLQNEAARLGANIVLVAEAPQGMLRDASRIDGEAYKCASF
jgi:hypothetical protein